MGISKNGDVGGGRSPPEGVPTSLLWGRNQEDDLKADRSNEPTRIVGGGARFENTSAHETMGTDVLSSFSSQSFTEEPEAGEKPIKPD